jgi:hypothetical protein
MNAETLGAAYDLGALHARNAASWIVDGNSDTRMARKLLRMMEDGDPAAEDYLPARPDLSGQYAGDLTPASLCEMFDVDTSDERVMYAMCDAYEDGVSETFEGACEQELRTFVED